MHPSYDGYKLHRLNPLVSAVLPKKKTLKDIIKKSCKFPIGTQVIITCGGYEGVTGKVVEHGTHRSWRKIRVDRMFRDIAGHILEFPISRLQKDR